MLHADGCALFSRNRILNEVDEALGRCQAQLLPTVRSAEAWNVEESLKPILMDTKIRPYKHFRSISNCTKAQFNKIYRTPL